MTMTRLMTDRAVHIVKVDNLRYAIELYIERRHPEFAYDTGLNGFFAEFITAALHKDFALEYKAKKRWQRDMAIYDDTTYELIGETLDYVINATSRHLSYYADLVESRTLHWEWLNERQLDIVITGRPT